MLNQPWIDPRDVDWTSALNGVRNPGFRINNNPFVNAALKDIYMQALANGKSIEPRIYVCPDPENQAIPPGVTFDYEVPSEPNTWVWAVSASLANPPNTIGAQDTLLVQITDSTTGSTLFSQPTQQTNLTGLPIISGSPTPQGSGNGYRGPQVIISTPHLYAPPSYPVVRLVNTSSTLTLQARVTLYTCVEYDL